MDLISTLIFISLTLTGLSIAALESKPYSQVSQDQFNILHHLGTGSYYHEAPGFGIAKSIPAKCTIDQAHLMMRHGERYPTANSGRRLQTLLEKLQNATSTMPNAGPFEFVKHYDYFVADQALYGQETFYNPVSGIADAFNYGTDLRLRYNHLFNKSDILPIFTAGQKRVYDTAVAFSQGFTGNGNGFSGDVKIVVLPESSEYGANSVTPIDACNNYNGSGNARATLYGNEDRSHLDKEADRLNDLVPGLNLNWHDVDSIAIYCAYETNVKGSSKFCDVLSMDGLVAFAYHKDLYHWYAHGPGYDLAYAVGGVLANATATLLEEGPNVAGKLFFTFAHDNDIVRYISALGLFDDQPNLPIDRIEFSRTFKTSDVVPLGARLLTERLSCTDSVTNEEEIYARITLNDQVFPIPGCYSGPGYSCPLIEYTANIREGLLDYASACSIDKDVPTSLSFYWDWGTFDYPTSADGY